MKKDDIQAIAMLVCLVVLIPLGAWLIDIPMRYVAGSELLFVGCVYVFRYVFGGLPTA